MLKNSSEKLRLLAADDSRVILKAMQKILGSEYEIIEARDGEEAWNIIEADSTICAVFTDMQMPKLDGLGLLKRIRNAEDSLVKSLPVILVTSAEDQDDTVKQAFGLGITDLISKPFDSLMLQARARTHVKARLLSSNELTASIDTVTKLANKSYFLDRGEKDRAFSIRHQHSMVVLLLAIDDFNNLSSLYSDIIKTVLMKVASRISALIRQEDTIAYLGPGQFGVLLLSIETQDLTELVERIRSKVSAKSFQHQNTQVALTISIGVGLATSDEAQQSFKTLAQQANVNLTRAIKAGGNRIVSDIIEEQTKPSEARFASLYKLLDQTLALINKNWGIIQTQQATTILLKLLPLIRRCDSTLKLNLDKILDALQKKLEKK